MSTHVALSAPSETNPIAYMADADLTELASNGDTESVAELHRRHHGAALRLAQSLTKCPTAADDVASEALLRTWQRMRGGSQPAHFRAYLLAAVRNHFLDTLRRGHHLHESVDDIASNALHDEALVSVDPTTQIVERLIFANVLLTLCETHRQVLSWSVLEGRSNTEVADRLGITVNAASSLTYRARLALRTAYLRLERQSAG